MVMVLESTLYSKFLKINFDDQSHNSGALFSSEGYFSMLWRMFV